MTTRELVARRIARTAQNAASQHLADYCDVYRIVPEAKDKAGAPREGTSRTYHGIACGVVPADNPVEIMVAGRTAGFAEATIYLTGDTLVRETDEIHVRNTRIAAYEVGSPAYLTEHQVFGVIGTDEIATHSHFLGVYVVRRR